MKFSNALILILLLVASPVLQAASDETELTRLLTDFMAGASVDDEAAHDRFWAEELVYTSSSGERFGKAEIMSGFDDTAESAEDEPATEYTAEDVRIQLYGETAVVTFRLVGKTQEAPPVVSQYFNTGTFLKRDGEWRAVAWQATKIPAPE
jgi:hypothetical protein